MAGGTYHNHVNGGLVPPPSLGYDAGVNMALKLLVALGVLATARPAPAAVAVRASVEDLARGADAVVRGRVVKLTARRSADGRLISTWAEVEVATVWRGSASPRVSVVIPGGAVGGIGQLVDGAPTLAAGEEVVLFLGAAGDAFRVRGLAQGKFSVSGGQARPGLSRVALVGPAPRPGERAVEEMSVEELEARVRAAR
jgi:hypothetical protein